MGESVRCSLWLLVLSIAAFKHWRGALVAVACSCARVSMGCAEWRYAVKRQCQRKPDRPCEAFVASGGALEAHAWHAVMLRCATQDWPALQRAVTNPDVTYPSYYTQVCRDRKHVPE